MHKDNPITTSLSLDLLDKKHLTNTYKTGLALFLFGFFVNTFLVCNYTVALLMLLGFAVIFFLHFFHHQLSINTCLAVLCCLGLGCLNIFWFLTEGIKGTSLLGFVIYSIVILNVLPLFYYKLFIPIILLNISILFGIEQLYPNLITLYPTNQTKEIDLLSIAFITIILSGFSIHFFRKRQEQKQEIIKQQNQDLINSQKELLQAKERAEKTNFNKSSFLAMMSHEVRTPLNAIIGISNLLQEYEYNDKQKEELIVALHSSSQQLLGLLNGILDFNLIESGKIRLHQQNAQLQELIPILIENYTTFAKKNGNSLSCVIEANVPTSIYIDPKLLEQVLKQLLSNACKFTSNGTVVLTVRVVEFIEKNVALLIEVKDTGEGISQKMLEQILNQFDTVSSYEYSLQNSIGFGLTIAHSLLRLMGSEIKVESNVNFGSRFYFTLTCPVLSNSPMPLVSSPPSSNKIESKILVVEDNKTNVLVLTHFLKKWNLAFEVAYNGLEATQLIKQQKFSLILMDIQMPIMDGFEATETIRKINASIPIIAVTASATQEEKEKALALGVNEYITKPFEPTHLQNIIQQHLPRS